MNGSLEPAWSPGEWLLGAPIFGLAPPGLAGLLTQNWLALLSLAWLCPVWPELNRGSSGQNRELERQVGQLQPNRPAPINSLAKVGAGVSADLLSRLLELGCTAVGALAVWLA